MLTTSVGVDGETVILTYRLATDARNADQS
jgi:hypothetical protein